MAQISAATNRATALAALNTQIDALINEAATNGQLFLTTLSLTSGQQTYVQGAGYVVTLTNGIYKISWEPTPA